MTRFDPLFFAKQNVLRCINCGHETALLAERLFKCPDCGGLYDVIHPATSLKINFGERFVPRSNAYDQTKGSGVWAFQELVLPGVPSKDIVSLGEKFTIVKISGHLHEWIGGDLDLWMIAEGISPSGSFKDYGMTVLATLAKLAGASAIMCASTGDTSAAAAAYAAAAGLQCVVLLPKGQVSAAQLVQPLAYGATVIEVPGDFDACMRILQELVANYGVYPANSLNPARIEGHQSTVFNAWLRFGRKLPEWFVVPLGNGSNTSSVGKGLRALGGTAKILSVQPEHAAPLADSFARAGGWNGNLNPERWTEEYSPVQAGQTIATAAKIGNPVSFQKVMREIEYHGGGVTSVSDALAREAMFAAGASGHMVCPQTGLALAGLKWAVAQGHVSSGARVSLISTAHGLKFTGDFLPQGDQLVGVTLDEASTTAAARAMGL